MASRQEMLEKRHQQRRENRETKQDRERRIKRRIPIPEANHE